MKALRLAMLLVFLPSLAASQSPVDSTTGSLNLGGPIATAGGLVFTAGAMDNRLRAFDADTGVELWSAELPAGGQATPMTYVHDGVQYLVVAGGGHGKLGTRLGDYVLAFTLP